MRRPSFGQAEYNIICTYSFLFLLSLYLSFFFIFIFIYFSSFLVLRAWCSAFLRNAHQWVWEGGRGGSFGVYWLLL